jgi:hypothetical protein
VWRTDCLASARTEFPTSNRSTAMTDQKKPNEKQPEKQGDQSQISDLPESGVSEKAAEEVKGGAAVLKIRL